MRQLLSKLRNASADDVFGAVTSFICYLIAGYVVINLCAVLGGTP